MQAVWDRLSAPMAPLRQLAASVDDELLKPTLKVLRFVSGEVQALSDALEDLSQVEAASLKDAISHYLSMPKVVKPMTTLL